MFQATVLKATERYSYLLPTDWNLPFRRTFYPTWSDIYSPLLNQGSRTSTVFYGLGFAIWGWIQFAGQQIRFAHVWHFSHSKHVASDMFTLVFLCKVPVEGSNQVLSHGGRVIIRRMNSILLFRPLPWDAHPSHWWSSRILAKALRLS